MCLKVLPDEPEYPYLIAMCHDKLNEYDKAFDFYTRSISIDSLDTRFYRSRANLCYKMQNFIKAIDDYNRIIAIEPDNGSSYFYRGVSKYKLNDKEGACADWHLALKNSFTKASEYIDKQCE